MSCSQSKGCLYPILISPVTACELVRTEHIVNTFSKWTPCILAQSVFHYYSFNNVQAIIY